MIIERKFILNLTSKNFVLLLLLITTMNTFGQVVFERGYFVDNSDEKIECLIKNYEWKNSPTKIEYKLTEDAESKFTEIADIKEFGVSNLKYHRFTVEIDKSSVMINNLSKVKEPIFEEETLFLKVLIEGEATLYSGGKPLGYFYKVNDSAVTQLIHKDYFTEDYEVATNNTYKSQLWKGLECPCITLEDIRNTGFNKRSLIKTFETYNKCVDSEYVNYQKNHKKTDINLRVKPGVRWSTFYMRNSSNSSQNIDYDGDLNFCFGLEAEFVFPFNKSKWAFTIEPTYQSYYAEDPRANYNNTVDYKSVEFPIGIKYNMFLNSKSILFLSAAFVIWDAPINSTIGTKEINSRNNLNLGTGYSHKNKYSIEFRYGTKRELLNTYVYYSSNYQSFSLFFGYNIF